MANYEINPAGVLDQAQELVSVSQTLKNSLENLQNSVRLFTAANEGQAPTAYAGSQTMWNEGQIQMNAAITRGQVRLQEIVAEYLRGDKTGAGVFNG